MSFSESVNDCLYNVQITNLMYTGVYSYIQGSRINFRVRLFLISDCLDCQNEPRKQFLILYVFCLRCFKTSQTLWGVSLSQETLFDISHSHINTSTKGRQKSWHVTVIINVFNYFQFRERQTD